MNLNNGLTLILFLSILTKSLSQQQSMYSQYMFNGLAINPGYAGSHESMSMTALARKQWVGFPGAPSTQTFTAHSPIKNDRVGLGLLLSHNNIGVTNQYCFNLAYAYRIPVGNGKISMGVQAGISNYNERLTSLYLGPNAVDPNFSRDLNSFIPSIGSGLYYYTSHFYFGFSSPQLISYINNISDKNYYRQAKHYFINTGYVFKLNSSFKLKPNILIKIAEGAPFQADINTTLLIKEVIWIGASYRIAESVSALFQLQLTDQFRLGYSYDIQTGSTLSRLNAGSHELMLSYNFTYFKTRFVSPRYF